MTEFASHAIFFALAAAWGWMLCDWKRRKPDPRVEFYDDLKSMASRIDTMSKFGPGMKAVATYVRTDGARFRLTVEKEGAE